MEFPIEMILLLFCLSSFVTVLLFQKRINTQQVDIKYRIEECYKVLIKNSSVASEAIEKRVGANRKPRTEEQKKLASLKKKAYWERVRLQKEQGQQATPAPVSAHADIS